MTVTGHWLTMSQQRQDNGDKNNRQTEALSPPGSQFKPELKQALSARIGG